jgi:hypothetical protein
MPKYEIVKSFTPEDFYRAILRDKGFEWKCEEFDKDLEWLIKYAGRFQDSAQLGSLEMGKMFTDYVLLHDNFRNHLIKYGFIREVEEKKNLEFTIHETEKNFVVKQGSWNIACFAKNGRGMTIIWGIYNAPFETENGHIKIIK